jgi:protein-S-isoprenylcysteine O-methyltransferase Ste14
VRRAALGTFVFLVVVPGSAAGLVPWWLTRWRASEPPPPPPIRAVGVVLLVAGILALLAAFVRFVVEGSGTPAPIAPTRYLVRGGLYRHVRNPMYLAVTAAILGQALVLGRIELAAYAGVFLAVTAAFVRWYEEPTLLRRYGESYAIYRDAVPGWWPRIRPWRPGEPPDGL